MNSNFEDWLEDLMAETPSNGSQEPASEQLPSVLPATLSSESPQPVDLSEEALEEIFQEYGFHEIQDAEEYVETSPVEDTPTTLDSTNTEESEEEGYEDTDEGEQEEEEVNTEAYVSSSPDLPPPLPENSPTLLMDDSTSRFSGTEWYNAITQKHVVIVGIGGIGSNLAFQIARMHPAVLTLFDPDVVEEANMSGQLFGRDDIGKYKVSAIYEMLCNYAPSPIIYTHRNRFLATTISNIAMCGFDNMEARKTFFNVWKNHVVSLEDDRKKECLYLDGRLSIDTLQVFCITGDDTYNMQRYEQEFLFSDAEAEETVCSMKQTTYLASMIASLMTNLFVNFVANSLDPVIPYDLPFFTQYDAQNMLFKTER